MSYVSLALLTVLRPIKIGTVRTSIAVELLADIDYFLHICIQSLDIIETNFSEMHGFCK